MAYTLPQRYQKLTEAEVATVLADKNDSQIMQELACLIDIYSKHLSRLRSAGANPTATLPLPSCALEKLALRMVVDAAGQDAAKKG